MGHYLITPISAQELADKMKLKLVGNNISVHQVDSLSNITAHGLCFSTKVRVSELAFPAILLAPPGTAAGMGAVLETENPRLAFARVLALIDKNIGFVRNDMERDIDPSVSISPSATIGEGVKIGARTRVGHNVVIGDHVTIGEDCYIKSNSVIGETGFGFERDENGIPIRILHLGNVIIGNRVEVGSLSTVIQATLGTTLVEDDVKIDDHVHVGHNCIVRRGAILTAYTELSGGVEVGECAWVGPHSSVIQKIKLGKHSFVGIGSNVIREVADYTTVAGNPARVLKDKNS